MMKKIALLLALLCSASFAQTLVQEGPSTSSVTATAAAGSAATCTISAPVAGASIFVVYADLDESATAAVAGTAPNIWTTTGIIGTPSYNLAGALASGAIDRVTIIPAAAGMKATSATAVTFVSPATANLIFKCSVTYFISANNPF